MLRRFKELALFVVIAFTLTAFAEMESGTKTLAYYSVNLASTDSATRAASYLSALYDAYPELTGSMKVKAERVDSLLGGLVTFTQDFNGIQLFKSKMWIRVLPNGTVNYVGGNFHKNIGLHVGRQKKWDTFRVQLMEGFGS
ncbi:hypothetical protein HUU59_04360 [bacterium]|nr:hypothetical protein [bacterium]